MYTSSEELTKELEQLSGWKRDSEKGFTLGFLLRKLPAPCAVYADWPELKFSAERYKIDGTDEPEKWHVHEADSPEDAACRLHCELFKQNILKKEPA